MYFLTTRHHICTKMSVIPLVLLSLFRRECHKSYFYNSVHQFKREREKRKAYSLQQRALLCDRLEVLPVGQTDSFDGVVAVVHFVSGFKHNTEPPAAKALYWLEVRQVPEEEDTVVVIMQRTLTLHSDSKEPVTSVIPFMQFQRPGIIQLIVITVKAY